MLVPKRLEGRREPTAQLPDRLELVEDQYRGPLRGERGEDRVDVVQNNDRITLGEAPECEARLARVIEGQSGLHPEPSQQLGETLTSPAYPPAFGCVGPGDEAAGEGVEPRTVHQVHGDHRTVVLTNELGGAVDERGLAVAAGRSDDHADAADHA